MVSDNAFKANQLHISRESSDILLVNHPTTWLVIFPRQDLTSRSISLQLFQESFGG
jgi:hypothetical protein